MTQRVGFVGLGTMGRPMAINVTHGDYEVTVNDLVESSVAALVEAGARSAPSPREAAQHADVVITMLPGPAEVAEVVLGADGIYAGMVPGSIHIDMSTIDPATTLHCAERARSAGIEVLDAPVGKSSVAAAAGELTIMVGGDAAVLEKCRALLSTMGSTIHHCGELGSGQAVKLCNNLVSGGILAIVAEAAVLAAKAGVDPSVLVEVLGGTGAANWQLQNTFGQKVFKGDFAPGFKTRLMLKDARLGLGMAKELGTSAPMATLVEQLYETATEKGLGDEDWGAYIKVVEELSGVQARYADGGAADMP